MPSRLTLISTATLALLFGFVATVLLAASYVTGQINAPLMMVLTIVINALIWMFSPTLMDLTLRWVYRSRWVEPGELAADHPEVVSFLEQACAKHQVPIPRLGLIDDQSPTAFTYGSTAGNARLVVSTGLFHYLTEPEARAVYAHELGHIVHRDFIVMSVGATLVQLLYQIYVIFSRTRSGGGGKKNQLYLVGLAAYVFYWLGTYLLLFLSRTREYLADQFAAEETGDPNALAMALTKIAYGIVHAEQEAGKQSQLQASTRALGVFDHKSARSVGVTFETKTDMEKVGKVFLFDLFNPWATVAELNSTHPLTGKRIRALANIARTQGQQPPFDFGRIAQMGNALDHGRMRSQFTREVGIYFAPMIGPVLGLAVGAATPLPVLACFVGGLGLGLLLKGSYSFGKPEEAKPAEFLDLMTDPYASPLKGRPVQLKGALIGKADAGSKISEDFMLQDRTGIVYLNYESPLGWIGNLFFAAKKGEQLVGAEVEATGWFRRGVMPQFDLLKMTTDSGEQIVSWTRPWALIPGVLAVGLALFLLVSGH